MSRPGRIIIVGAGIAGLCAAVYARKCGYDTVVLEQNTQPGGLAASWRRGGYTFETGLHSLHGSRPGAPLNATWREVFDIGRLRFIDPPEQVRMVGADGEELAIHSDVDRMEVGLLVRVPQDAAPIRDLAAAVRRLGGLRLVDNPEQAGLTSMMRAIPGLPLIARLSRCTAQEYGSRFQHPLLRAFFGSGDMAGVPALAVLRNMAWMSQRNAGYPIGGSQAVIQPIVAEFARLGGALRLGTRVRRILVERDCALGVELANGEVVGGTAPGRDWVICAADGHAAIYELLLGRYTDAALDNTYRTRPSFPSYVQVSLGVARDLSQQAPCTTRLLAAALEVDPGTRLDRLSVRVFHFDPGFAPQGGTAVTVFLPTRNVDFWVELKALDPARYGNEKRRVAEAVIGVLDQSMPGLRRAVEVTDVSTPASVIAHTGNFRGSMEGWLPVPGSGFAPLRTTLPGLANFRMIGQWVMPGGGLPAGLITARAAVAAICRQDGVPFRPEPDAGRAHEAA
jgi:phytoene dehydrogenase-like protein